MAALRGTRIVQVACGFAHMIALSGNADLERDLLVIVRSNRTSNRAMLGVQTRARCTYVAQAAAVWGWRESRTS